MEHDAPNAALAPPVVAVVVVHNPGAWFDETLDSLARQDYPNLNTFFLFTGGPVDADGEDLTARILARVPDAFLRELGTNPGYGEAANTVLDLVDGDNGFFCFCHDDVALDSDAIRLLVEELYRSNAGIIGPKLVDWDNVNVLMDVGLDADPYGQPASRVEPGEYDQEQHDAVTDVFAVPSACLLTRADLFRQLGGFDTTMNYHGDDVDLCWRAHISGARVMVAPAARARHRQDLEARRPDLNHAAVRARHRVRSTLTLTSGARLPGRMLELIGVTLLEFVLGIFTGHLREGWASLRAVVGAIPRFPSLLARRGAIAKIRRVSDSEVRDLQSRGANALSTFGKARETRLFIGVEDNVRAWRDRSIAPVITWAVIVIAVIAASRTFINRSVPAVGEFLPFPDSPRELWSDFVSGWNPSGLGATSANPTGYAVLALSSVVWFFHMGFGLTVLIIGLMLLGGLGVWRLSDLFPSNRERIVALVTYMAMPLLPGVLSTGRLSALVAFAAVPWFVHLLRLAVGIGTADPRTMNVDLPDGLIELGWRERVRRAAVAAIVVALAIAMAPSVLLIVLAVAVVLGASTLLSGASWMTAAWLTGTGVLVCGAAWLLNVPAATVWSWDGLTATSLAGANGRGLTNVLVMDIGDARLGLLSLALYIPVLTGLALSRAWRLTWAGRAAGLVVVFGALAVMQDRDSLPIRVPDIGLLLVPVALGLSLSAACAVASFSSDVAGGTFGWRQPLGLVSIGAVLVGLFPALVTLTDGAWFAPDDAMAQLVGQQVQPDADFGSFRVLYLGDPRLIPVASEEFAPGIGMAVSDPGVPDIRSRWVPPDTAADAGLRAALTEIASNATQRGGRLLAPFGIRYIVVPQFDGNQSTLSKPIDPPDGLLGALASQLDLGLQYSPSNFVLYANQSAFPEAAVFTGGSVAAAAATTPAQLVQTDLSTATAAFPGVPDRRSATSDIEAGTVHLAVPFDDQWQLEVAGTAVPARAGFGVLTAFDAPAAGAAHLHFESPASRRAALLGQGVLWLLVLLLASRLKAPARLRRLVVRGRALSADEAALIDLDADHVDLPTHAGDVPVLIPLEPRLDPGAAWVDEMFDDDDSDEAGRS